MPYTKIAPERLRAGHKGDLSYLVGKQVRVRVVQVRRGACGGGGGSRGGGLVPLCVCVGGGGGLWSGDNGGLGNPMGKQVRVRMVQVRRGKGVVCV